MTRDAAAGHQSLRNQSRTRNVPVGTGRDRHIMAQTVDKVETDDIVRISVAAVAVEHDQLAEAT